MKPNRLLSVALAAALLCSQGTAVLAQEGVTTADAAFSYGLPSYKLNEDLKVEVKSLLNEFSSEGVKVGAAIRVKNTSVKSVRIPDYELRIKTEEGAEYYLLPSFGNSPVIRAKSNEELSYMGLIDRNEEIRITEVSLVDVDWYTFPKTETTVLTMPATSEWKGNLGEITDPAFIKAWGEEFQIPALDSELVYKPVSYYQENTKQGVMQIIKLQVENTTGKREKIPVFLIQGRSGEGDGSSDSGNSSSGGALKSYEGQRVESGDIIVEPGERKYIHYSIPVDSDTRLDRLYVLTPESFKDGAAAAVTFSIGRLSILPPVEAGQFSRYPVYTKQAVMQFDPLSKFIHPLLDVSMVELNLHENEAVGYQTAVAKFKLHNKSDLPIPVPLFHAELMNEQGVKYSGVRQTTSIQEVTPHAAYVVSYAFVLPNAERQNQFILKLSDTQAAAPYKSEIGGYRVAAEQEKPSPELFPTLAVYPFEVKVNDWRIESYYAPAAVANGNRFAYKMVVNLDISRLEDVIVDENFQKLQFELRDPIGKILGVKNIAFTGMDKAVSGKQTFYFDNIKTEQVDYPLSVHVYETMMTPNGEAQRLLTVFQM